LNSRKITISILLFLFVGLVTFKVFYLDYSPSSVVPVSGYQIAIQMQVDGHGAGVNVHAALPSNNDRQTIFDEQVEGSAFNFSIDRSDGNRFGHWQAANLSGRRQFNISFKVKSQHVKYVLPEKMSNGQNYDAAFKEYLQPTKLVQTGNPAIADALALLGLDRNSDVIEAVRRVYDFTSNKITTTGFSGKTDAITTLKLGEASCNGKSRLFVALMRTLGVPSRLVGGLIMKPGRKRVTHQWVEVYLGDKWTPFDPTNKHFAELPARYLTFYYGDQPFFQRTANVNFKYAFVMDKKLFPQQNDYHSLANHPLNIMNAWSLFQRAGLSMELLRIILMIPIGALVTVIFRNVIGLRTFGTFLPALIASAFRESGLLWGLITFISIIATGSLLRRLLDRLRIMHTPKLTIILVYIVLALLTVSALGVKFNNMDIAHATLFPLALMAITVERTSLLIQENGYKDALIIFANTILAVILCYLVINSLFLQTVVLAFPETMLLVICTSLYLGNWVGLRVSELVRFKSLVFAKEEAA